ncbi:MAG TPA: PP2C family protein-serine/threonine phosphatase [Vicinamibacteria bacterium]|nr:PP2C family protein-serine/threonine phosphatase [Vicinamibacteria bacterium]
MKAPRPLARRSSPAALEVDEETDLGPLSRAVLVGEGVPPRIRAAIEEQAEVETWGLADIFDAGARSPDLLVLYAGLPEAALREALARLGPRSRPGRPTVLMACSPEVPAPAALLDEVDEIINDVMKDAELQLRLRAVLRARGALLALQRKNAELEGLYARVESLAGRMAEELRLASQVQRSLLPPPFAHPRLDVAREYIPVREIGGDYYDLLPLDEDRVVFALGDVMGKGVPAALLAANLKACLRAHLQTGVLAPAELIARVNRLFWEVTPKGLFASLFFGVLDLGRGMLEFVNAGHDHPFLVRGDGSLRDLSDGGTVLGLLEDSRYERGVVPVEVGDFLVLFSDGLTDRSNLDGELYGVGRLKEAARSNRGSSARLLLYSLLGEVQGFSAGEPATADATLIVAQVR